MPITYNAGTNTLTFEFVVGDPIGNSMANPYTMQSLYDASVAGGWGVITKSDNMYNISCKIVGAGVALTYFKGEYEVWYWHTNTGNDTISIKEIYLYYVKVIKNTYGGTFTITTEGTINRCSFENSQLFYFYGRSTGNLIVTDSSLLRIQSISFANEYVEIHNMQIIQSYYGINRNQTYSNEYITISNSGSAIYTYLFKTGYANAFRKLLAINCQRSIMFRTTGVRELYFIDCELDYSLYGSTTNATGKDTVHALSTFVFKFGDGVHLVLKDQFGTTVLDKDINMDDSDEVEFHNHVFEYLSGTGVIQDVITNYYPFTAIITKAGYQTLIIPGITINGMAETILEGELIRPELIISAITITDCTSIGADDGKLEITAEGGDGTYEYSLDGVTYQAGNTFSGLSAGDYTVYVKDGEGTVTTFDVTVSQPIPEAYAEDVLTCDLTEESLDCDLAEEVLTCDFIE